MTITDLLRKGEKRSYLQGKRVNPCDCRSGFLKLLVRIPISRRNEATFSLWS
jgi:hypothetical protein